MSDEPYERWVALGRDRSRIAGVWAQGEDEARRKLAAERLLPGTPSRIEWDDVGQLVCREWEQIPIRRAWRDEREAHA